MSRPWMPLYIADYLKDTAHLRAAESGAYLHLIMSYWTKGSLPDDDRQLATIAKMTLPEWKRARPVLEAFFSPGFKSHKRIDRELAEANEKYQRRASAGSKGGTKTAEKRSNAGGNAASEQAAMRHQPQSQSQKEDDGDDVRATLTPEAWKLAEEIAVIAGHPDKLSWPPGWCGAPMRAQSWLNEGWRPEICVIAARSAMARKRDGPPHSIQFFEAEITREHARQSKPLPVAVASQSPEAVHVRPVQADRSLSSAAWRAVDNLAGDGRQDDLRGTAGRLPVRAIPSSRGQ